MGVAFKAQQYSSTAFSQFDYSYEVPALFAQLDYEHSDEIVTSYSARVDSHSEYGSQFSPRVSVLYQPSNLDEKLTIRGSYGEGYYAPTPFIEEIQANGLSRLAPISDLQHEQAQTASLDFTYRFDSIETSFTLFSSDVENVTELEPFKNPITGVFDRVRLVNAQGVSKIRGSEVLLRYYWQDIKLTASYLHLDSLQQSNFIDAKQQWALTPKHSAGFVAMWERHGEFRAGFEAYYTGTQRLDDNPYMAQSKPYWHLGIMGEYTIGQASWFVNFENLLDVKQTDEHPMLLPAQGDSGQWTTDIWSRNDGFIVNAGVRIKFGH